MTVLTQHFTLEEFTFSETAIRHDIYNMPESNELDNLLITAEGMENVRKLLNNNAINVSSGYRCLELNTLLKSKPNSKHVKGLACDFTCKGFGTPEKIVRSIVNSNISYDQVILEYGSWVHIAFCKNKKDNKKQALIIDNKGVRMFKDNQ